MSHQVIARKWRPQAFDEVTGQDHITRTLRNGIEHGRLHHAYVFSGARGVGKTTTARLFAKALNCHKAETPNAEPCKFGDVNICPSCLEITESRSMDVIEFDAASNTGVQDIRDIILENINVSAARDRYRIFIIDEVHMLSTSSFNALLKTVEEPPPNVVFVMATTELHKVPDTITSRSQEFIFRTIPQAQIFSRLRLIADAEKINIEDAALQMIARSGEGSMRDAQSNFDQVISFSGDSITTDDVTKALGLASSEVIEKTVVSLATGDSKVALAVVADLVDRGQDLRIFCRDVLAILRDLLIFKVSGGETTLVETSVLSMGSLKLQSDRFTEADLVRLFHALAETETRLKDAVQSRYVLEIGLVKLIEMRRLAPVENIVDRLNGLEARLSAGSAPSSTSLAVAASPEKKTLTIDAGAPPAPVADEDSPDLPARPVSVYEEPELGIGYHELSGPDEPPEDVDGPPTVIGLAQYDDLSFVASLPVKLPAIASEDLEHFDDKVLDAQYVRKLEIIDEMNGPIPRAAELVRHAIGQTSVASRSVAVSNGAAAAPARAPLNIQIPTFAEDESPKLAWPGDEASKEELIAYANSQPSIKLLKRVFRAKVTGVTKKAELS
ncbi:MAG: DNA polymerase III subunit gamma/tau [bacterium]|nr:DNA polymerase III subunit gamma/tau [bacterium]